MGGIIEGVELHPLKHIVVPKGDIYHAFKSTDDGYVGFGEVYFSQIEHGAIKGWKRHNQMVLNIVVPVGSVKFVIYDDRIDSKTCGCFYEVTLSLQDNYQRLTIKPGLWMAFMGVAEGISMLMDVIPEVHSPNEADRKDLLEIDYKFEL